MLSLSELWYYFKFQKSLLDLEIELKACFMLRYRTFNHYMTAFYCYTIEFIHNDDINFFVAQCYGICSRSQNSWSISAHTVSSSRDALRSGSVPQRVRISRTYRGGLSSKMVACKEPTIYTIYIYDYFADK